jgi:LmbE family N-acetylglucosaminyl deacetylase
MGDFPAGGAVVFSRCTDVSLALHDECYAAMEKLNKKVKVYLEDFPNKRLADHRDEIRDVMEGLEAKVEPQQVFVPCSEDRHQDHRVVFEEAVRAFKYCTILGYVQPWNCLREPYHMYVPLSRVAVQRKARALKCYKSQASKTYMQPRYVDGLARHLGWKIGREFAEGFEVVRMVVAE